MIKFKNEENDQLSYEWCFYRSIYYFFTNDDYI